MKAIAFYLPQFHAIEENDRWWGEGFTEWTNVKKAAPLFAGHRQPRRPMAGRYYDLSDVETLRWQAALAKDHGIAGFCFYHYFFGGKRLLEKPIELLLAHPDIDLPFCVAWANESWTRTWDGGDREVLMGQRYGGKAEWDVHFALLLRFFQDPRYLRSHGKPVLLIYRSPSIDECAAMLTRWRQLAEQAGIGGLHIVEMLTVFDPESRPIPFDMSVEFEPMLSLRLSRNPRHKTLGDRARQRFEKITRGLRRRRLTELQIQNYRSIWAAIIRRPLEGHYPGVFLDWDNTPRRGARGTVFTGFKRSIFQRGLEAQIRKGRAEGAEFLFVNAWNEWAEGTYLEPDEDRGLFFLEEFKKHFAS